MSIKLRQWGLQTLFDHEKAVTTLALLYKFAYLFGFLGVHMPPAPTWDLAMHMIAPKLRNVKRPAADMPLSVSTALEVKFTVSRLL